MNLAAYLWEQVDGGCSFLTAARPGGAGKSTVLANMLNFLPAGASIRTVASGRDLPLSPAGDEVCYLAHEIGSGPYFAYLWGSDARAFFDLAAAGGRVASCMHADTLDELESVLTGWPNSLSPEAFAAMGVIAFIHMDTRRGVRRRVCRVYQQRGSGLNLAYRWDPATDTFLPCSDTSVDSGRAGAIRSLVGHGVRDLCETRRLLIS